MAIQDSVDFGANANGHTTMTTAADPEVVDYHETDQRAIDRGYAGHLDYVQHEVSQRSSK